jgi:hypothetical protein
LADSNADYALKYAVQAGQKLPLRESIGYQRQPELIGACTAPNRLKMRRFCRLRADRGKFACAIVLSGR